MSAIPIPISDQDQELLDHLERDAGWADEIKQRVAAIRDGKVSCISEEQMMDEIEEDLK